LVAAVALAFRDDGLGTLSAIRRKRPADLRLVGREAPALVSSDVALAVRLIDPLTRSHGSPPALGSLGVSP
jgi:hypothetical protein